MKHKTASILLLLCLVVPPAATFSFLHIQKLHIKAEVRQKIKTLLSDNELTLLSFSTRELSEQIHMHHDKEFEYQGQMYDIVRSSSHGDSTYYWCILDHKETALNAKIAALIVKTLGHNTDRRKSHKRLHDFFSTLYCYPQQERQQAPMQHTNIYASHAYRVIMMTITPPSPPPQYC